MDAPWVVRVDVFDELIRIPSAHLDQTLRIWIDGCTSSIPVDLRLSKQTG